MCMVGWYEREQEGERARPLRAAFGALALFPVAILHPLGWLVDGGGWAYHVEIPVLSFLLFPFATSTACRGSNATIQEGAQIAQLEQQPLLSSLVSSLVDIWSLHRNYYRDGFM